MVLLLLLDSMEVLHLTESRRHNLLLDSKSLQLLLVVLSRLQLVDLGIINFLERVSKEVLSLKLKQLGLIIILLRPVLTTPRDRRA